MYALISTPEGPRYGYIVSRHHTVEAAQDANHKLSGAVRDQCPNALTHLMYEVVELPTPAGGTGKVGDRIAIDLSR